MSLEKGQVVCQGKRDHFIGHRKNDPLSFRPSVRLTVRPSVHIILQHDTILFQYYSFYYGVVHENCTLY